MQWTTTPTYEVAGVGCPFAVCSLSSIRDSTSLCISVFLVHCKLNAFISGHHHISTAVRQFLVVVLSPPWKIKKPATRNLRR